MRLLLIAAPFALSGCFLFETDCDKVANAICTVPGEEASCRFLHDVKRDNDAGQKACEQVLPAAQAYAKDPTSLVQKTQWALASTALRVIGFVGEQTKDDRLDKARRGVGDAAREAGEALGDAAKKAGDAVGKAVEDVGKR